MVDDDSLSAVLSDFARTMLTDFSIQDMLDLLVDRIVDVLPITGAGITLISEGRAPQYLAASNAQALRFERLQSELGEGPCLAAFETGEPVFIADLADDDRFPEFGPAALAAGMAAVFTFPLRHGGGRLGALDLYRDSTGPLDAAAREAAQTLADVATAYLLNAQSREETARVAEWYRERSLHDGLTGLPNRTLLAERLEHAALRAQRTSSTVAVLFVDLDNFKRVNDAYGHPIGDELLVAVSDRLSALVRPGDTIARVSGDEFVFLCEDLADADDVESLVERIDAAFAEPFALSIGTLRATASVGIAYAGPGETVSDELVIEADMAMYQSKRRGGATHQVVDLRVTRAPVGHHNLEHDLRAALSGATLDLSYQPIVHIADGLTTGVEALLRWTHPARGPISAATAIAVAEQSGLITGIGTWVLQRSCRDWVDWLARYPGRSLDLAVNVSGRQLMAPGFAASVARVLDDTGMDPTALVLEITEAVFAADHDRASLVVNDLRTRGVRVAVDDFGTGATPLADLRRFSVDIVKIDPRFAAGLGHDPDASATLSAVTQLAHLLGKSVTAEGVETKEESDRIAQAGCEYAQGFYFARPMPARNVAAHLS
ncbi:MAG: putative bifunctional diguanylate cyclase/phosphodiesterase [Cellulomonas sp.]